MEFTSQICTTNEQSERLLALGLKSWTADMGIVKSTNEIYIGCPTDYSFERDLHIPAWSLNRLIEMLTYQVIHNSKKYEPVIAIDGMAYQDVCNDDPIVGWSGNLYTDIIDCIEWIINIEQFNQEYLHK